MADEYLQNFLDLVQSIPIPKRDLQNDNTKRYFRLGYDLVSGWSGHPDQLIDALKLFMVTESRTHVLAGIALVLSCASYESGNNYGAEGMQFAFRWLERCGKLVQEHRDLGLVEATLYLRDKKLDEAYKVVERLSKQGDKDYYFCDIAIQYWYSRGNTERVERWFNLGLPLAASVTQQLNLQKRLAGFYIMHQHYEKATEHYIELLKLDPDNPWSWHNLSICYLNSGNLDEASRCNQKALKIADFGAARQVEKTIAKKRSPK